MSAVPVEPVVRTNQPLFAAFLKPRVRIIVPAGSVAAPVTANESAETPPSTAAVG